MARAEGGDVTTFGQSLHLMLYKIYIWCNTACTSNSGYCREEKSCKHWSLLTKLSFSVPAFFNLLDQIKSNFMYWLHWKSEKNRTEPNELDELKYSKSFNQTTNYVHWHAFLYLRAQIKTFIYSSFLKSEKRSKLNEQS